MAVDKLSLVARRGECFGLLGVNGGGKTTTMRMLTGDLDVSSGDADVHGFSVREQVRDVQQHIGYCPQFDALSPSMTGRETLTMYARLRGVPPKDVAPMVQRSIERLALARHADARAMTYSGGNKRKLSAAIALVRRAITT